MTQTHPYIESAKKLLDQEIKGLEALVDAIDENFIAAVDIIANVKGRLVISGMGKSGHIARKIAATMASTGTPAMFIHPAEASHGDLGMVTKDDAVMLLSNSGETAELGDMIHYCKRFGIPLIAMVRRGGSMLVDVADVGFVLPNVPEASPVGAPTTSTTMMLAWGDALSMALLDKQGFNKEDFGVFHPGGKLGSQLLKVGQIMRDGSELPLAQESTLMSDALIEMTSKSLGCAAVVDGNNVLLGIITDGDLRRHVAEINTATAGEVMTKKPVCISQNMLAVEALSRMNDKNITSLFVTDEAGVIEGIVHIHDLLRAGVS